jgi:8-oxo-dGTP diphosphatase
MASLGFEEIRFCVRCSSELELAERFGAVRPVCPRCEWIYFADPKVAAAAFIVRKGEVLLVRRANDPQRGLWTLPAGFIDAGEDPQKAVVRECLEETGLNVRVTGLYDVLSGLEHTRGANILIVYRATVTGGTLQASDDVDQAGYFRLDLLPPLAFSTTQKVIDRWLKTKE